MGRKYRVPIDNVTIGTAVQDIFAVKCGAGVAVVLHAIHLDSVNTVAVPCRMRLKRGASTVTLGSGGSVVTPVTGPNDSAAASTAHINDTAQATTSGGFTTVAGFNWDTVLPFDFLPTPEQREIATCIVDQGLIFDLPATITAVTVSGYMDFEEVP